MVEVELELELEGEGEEEEVVEEVEEVVEVEAAEAWAASALCQPPLNSSMAGKSLQKGRHLSRVLIYPSYF